MKIIFTKHVEKRMKERFVSRGTVIDVLLDYDNILPGDGDSDRYIKMYQERVITVTVIELKRKEETYLITSVIVKRIR